MSTVNRRDFLKTGSLAVVAAGVVTAVPLLPSVAGASNPAKAPALAPEPSAGPMDEPLVARVVDVDTGEIDLFYGESHVVTHDTVLANRLLRGGQVAPTPGRLRQAGRPRSRTPDRPSAGPFPQPVQPDRGDPCPPIVKHPRFPRTPSPTPPTCTRSSAPTSRTGHPDRQLHPPRGSRRRPELLRVR